MLIPNRLQTLAVETALATAAHAYDYPLAVAACPLPECFPYNSRELSMCVINSANYPAREVCSAAAHVARLYFPRTAPALVALFALVGGDIGRYSVDRAFIWAGANIEHAARLEAWLIANNTISLHALSDLADIRDDIAPEYLAALDDYECWAADMLPEQQ